MSDCIDHGHKAPRYSVGSLNGVKTGLHRIVYCKAHGLSLEDLQGLVVMHTCDNPRCINPDHLRAGTQKENMADRFRKGRANMPYGDTHVQSAVTEAQREEIRRRVAAGELKKNLAAEYCVAPSTITRYLKE